MVDIDYNRRFCLATNPDFSRQFGLATNLDFSRQFCLAPMMNRTDRHMRYFFRLVSRHALLYTEMINAKALTLGGRTDLLAKREDETLTACQLGGNDYREMAGAARIAESMGYCEVNMNVGCPSQRVQDGDFGACLMLRPDLVVDCLKAMRDVCDIEVSVKCRIGVDDNDSYEFLRDFVDYVSVGSGISVFVVHARIAKLSGLSPKENRTIPPLRHDIVRRLRGDFGGLRIVTNGGVGDIGDCSEHLCWADGVMVGRSAVDRPLLYSDIDGIIFGDCSPARSRLWLFSEYLRYCESEWLRESHIFKLLRPLQGLFHGDSQARRWREGLSDIMSCGSIDSMRLLYASYERHVCSL